jgi:hypothetical protein
MRPTLAAGPGPRAANASEATVKTRVNRIFAKTGSRDRTQAIRYAYTHGYVDRAQQLTPQQLTPYPGWP